MTTISSSDPQIQSLIENLCLINKNHFIEKCDVENFVNFIFGIFINYENNESVIRGKQLVQHISKIQTLEIKIKQYVNQIHSLNIAQNQYVEQLSEFQQRMTEREEKAFEIKEQIRCQDEEIRRQSEEIRQIQKDQIDANDIKNKYEILKKDNRAIQHNNFELTQQIKKRQKRQKTNDEFQSQNKIIEELKMQIEELQIQNKMIEELKSNPSSIFDMKTIFGLVLIVGIFFIVFFI